MKTKPNIIFVLTDDQGAWAVESDKNHDIKTPNLTRLAKEGVTFDEFYCTSPVCSPARASIVTGKIPSCSRLAGKRKSRCLEIPAYGAAGRLRYAG